MPLVEPRSLMKYVPFRRITAACLREMLPSLMGRSDDLAPRPMMNWSLSMRYFWLSNTRYSGGAGTPGAPSENELAYDADGGGGVAAPAWNIPPRPPLGAGMGRPKRVAAGSGGGGGAAWAACDGCALWCRPWAVPIGGGVDGPSISGSSGSVSASIPVW